MENEKTTPASTAENKLADLLGKAVAPLSDGINSIDGKVDALASRVDALEKGHTPAPSEADQINDELDEANDHTKALADRLSQDRREGLAPSTVTPENVFGEEGAKNPTGGPNVLPASNRYDASKKGIYYPEMNHRGHRFEKSGLPVEWRGRPLNETSQKEAALVGAWFQAKIFDMIRRNQATRSMCEQAGILIPDDLSEHTKELVKEAYNTLEFEWSIGGQNEHAMGYRGMLPKNRVKALLNDSGSGGEDLVPVPLDDAIIRDPILFSEVFAFVTVMDLNIGNSIDHGKVGTPTWTWGGNSIEGSAVDLYDTTDFATKITTTIRSVAGAMELGKFFLQDTPLAAFNEVRTGYGESFLQELDRVCVNGNGTTEPIGLFATSGTNTYSAKNSTSGPLLISDLERMIFAVARQYRKNTPNTNFRWFGTDSTYRRMRQIPVGSNDARRLLGTDNFQDYMVLGYGYSVENNGNDNDLGFADLRRYKMVRRNGLNFTITDQGKELVRKNQIMIVGRARMGGQLHYAGAMAEMNNAPTLN